MVAIGLGFAPDSGYRTYVSSESGDIVSQLAWDGAALRTVKVVPVGVMPSDIDGPHNVTVSPDGRYWYVTIAHGTPFGSLWKMAVDGDTLVGRAPVEMFPTTISVTPDGELAFVANSDFYGDDPRTNVGSVIYTPQMVPLATLPACDMPHGVKVNHAGTRVYVSCMNSDAILEIDRARLAIARRHRTGAGMLPALPMPAGHGGALGMATHEACSPTFVSVSPNDHPAVRRLQSQQRAHGARRGHARPDHERPDRPWRLQRGAFPRRALGDRDEQEGSECVPD
jgi:DNA-binding beta-propeller fold protein YncE